MKLATGQMNELEDIREEEDVEFTALKMKKNLIQKTDDKEPVSNG